MPKRIQLRRTKGWRMPPNTVSVARPNKWGNPFRVNVDFHDVFWAPDNESAVRMFRRWLCLPGYSCLLPDRRQWIRSNLCELRGKNLACWCRLSDPCHADVLLELANRPATAEEVEKADDNIR